MGEDIVYSIVRAVAAILWRSGSSDLWMNTKELNYYPLLDNVLFEEFKTMRPFFNIPDLSKPFSVSNRLTLDKPNNTILSRYLADKSIKGGDDSLLSELNRR